MTHDDHPRLAKPITKAQFRKEFDWVWKRSRLRLVKKIIFPDELSELHCRNSRRYAQVSWGPHNVARHGAPYVFEFAIQTLWLPQANRIGLIAHEIGHVLCPGSEKHADLAAFQVLKINVSYDRRWRGKGLQTATIPQFDHDFDD